MSVLKRCLYHIEISKSPISTVSSELAHHPAARQRITREMKVGMAMSLRLSQYCRSLITIDYSLSLQRKRDDEDWQAGGEAYVSRSL